MLLLWLCSGMLSLQGQSWIIQGNIEHAEPGHVWLASYYGDRFDVIDSMETSSGFFYFVLPGNAAPGIYRLIFADHIGEVRNQDRFVEFIFHKENLEIYVASSEQGPEPYFEQSTENLVYNEFINFELGYEEELMSLYARLESGAAGEVPEDEGSLPVLVERYNQVQEERMNYMDSLTSAHPDLYAVKIMNAFRSPHVPGEMSHKQRIDTLQQSFFDHAGIDDRALLAAPVYTFKIIDYLSLYRDLKLSHEEQEEGFVEAVDMIMANVSGDPELRTFVVS